jgi:hypothetical protein
MKRPNNDWYIEQAARYANQLSDLAGELGTGIETSDSLCEPAEGGIYVQAWIFVPDPKEEEMR